MVGWLKMAGFLSQCPGVIGGHMLGILAVFSCYHVAFIRMEKSDLVNPATRPQAY